MLDALFSLVFLPFSFEPVLYCCAFSLLLAVFGLVRRFITGNYEFK